MPKQILVASPHLAFGELLRLSLEESGQYRVRLAQTSAEARGSAGRAIFSLLILDADLKDCTFAELTREIQEQQSQARLILIPPDNNPQHPVLKGLSADAYLNKPFYLPDLMETVERLMTAPVAVVEAAPEPAAQPANTPEAAPEGMPADVPALPTDRPAWLKNTTGAQLLLDEAVNDSRARAAIVLNGGQVCASSGNLPPAAVQELTEILARTWERHKNYDLARFIRLKEGGEHLLYATSLADQVALALACDVTLPLTRARGKAILLARQLADLPPEEEPAAPVAVAAQPPEPEPLAAQPAPEPDLSEEDTQLEDEEALEDGGMEIPDLRLLELLADAPPPNPVPASSKTAQTVAAAWAPEAAGETAPHALNLPWEQILAQPPVRLPDDPPSPYDAPTIAIRRRPAASSDAPTVAVRAQENGNVQPVPQTPAPTELISTPPPILPASAAPQAAPEAIAAPQPFVDPPPGSLLSVEPVSPTLSHLAYTALLIPRIPQHILVGELSEELGLWVPQLCLAFGWRLEGMSIRPETLQFTLQVAPSVSPGNVVRILRQRTSQRIFSRFPELKELNPSGDFWAPGYLIISGSTPPQPNLLHDFVVQTRRRQGLTVS